MERFYQTKIGKMVGKILQYITAFKELTMTTNTIDQFQMRAFLAACRELAVDYDTFPKLLYIFGHKT